MDRREDEKSDIDSGAVGSVQASAGSEVDWSGLNARLARVDPREPSSLRDALADLYSTVAQLPLPDLQDFEDITEAELDDNLEARALRVSDSHAMVEVGGDTRSLLLDAARLLRAMEANLAEFGRHIEGRSGESIEDAWRTADGRHYVIRRVTPLAPLEGRAFLRRALRNHRILPTSVGGFAVRLHRTPLMLSASEAQRETEGKPQRYGVSMFPGFCVGLAVPAPSPKKFLVNRVEGADQEGDLQVQAVGWRREGCRAVVWPELTMPDVALAKLRCILRDGPLGEESPQYLVAGSWHRSIGSDARNVATVLDGLGETLFEIFKWAKFKIKHATEAITPGREIHVLVCEAELVAFAICKDFLEESKDPPYRQLNVDLVIVPSMTSSLPDEKTMTGHAATAHAMSIRYGTRTLVVAQPSTAAPAEAGVGEVLAFPKRPLMATPRRVRTSFEVCTLEI